MMYIHKGLTPERWYAFSLFIQLANVGTDVARVFHWRKVDDIAESQRAFDRAMELLDFTILDPKHKRSTRRELCRVREALKDFVLGDNEYGTDEKFWDEYFYAFGYAAALEREQRYQERLKAREAQALKGSQSADNSGDIVESKN